MTHELQHKHRPTMLKEVIGQDSAVKLLNKFLKTNSLPHALLLCGYSGCGKTTIARILKTKLQCADPDFCEINAANTRGVDTVREIQSRVKLAPALGPTRIWLIDECFHGDTLVRTHRRPKKIKDFKKGDIVRNVSGLAVIQDVFRNRVDLERIVKLTFDDGRVIFTTKQHEFLTNVGWVEAQKLDSEHCIFGVGGYHMNTPKAEETTHAVMPVVSEGFRPQEQNATMLLEGMCVLSERTTKKERKDEDFRMPVLSQDYGVSSVSAEGVLQSLVSCQAQVDASGSSTETLQQGSSREDQYIPQEVSRVGKWTGDTEATFAQDENQQPQPSPRDSRQDKGDQEEERNTPHLDRGEGRERDIHGSREVAVSSVGGRLADAYGGAYQEEVSLSNQLQAGRGTPQTQDRHRGRWEVAQVEAGYNQRCQEGTTACRVRLASAEVYQRGRNESFFMGVVSDQDRDRGYVEFYDLQVCGHPSYFANGLPVHNCHKLSNDAQNCFLKILEDVPNHAYFFLCTTDPQKLITTVRGRCTTIKLEPLSAADLTRLLTSIATKEEVQIGLEVIEKIVEVSEGSAREAVKRLNAAIHLESDEERLKVIEDPVAKRQAFELVKLLVYDRQPTWAKAVALLKTVEVGNRESFRHFVLACARTELLKANGNARRAWTVIDVCKSPWYGFDEVGLEHALFEVCQEISGGK